MGWAPGTGQAGWVLRAPAGLLLGPQEALRPAGPEARHLPGHVGPEQRMGWGEARRAGPGLERPRVGGRRDLRAPHPTAQGPHTRTPGQPLGVPEALWPPGPTKRLLAAGWWCSGAWRLRQAEGSCGSSTACAPVVRCGRLARLACQTCQSEREAQRRAFRAPGGSRLRLPPYHPAHQISRLHI